MNITRKAIKEWCEEKGMSFVGLSNIAYVSYGTIKHLLSEDSKVLIAKIHVYNLTGLEILKPSELEIQEYETSSANPKNDLYWERKISEKFVSDWKKTASYPPLEFRLTNGVGDSKQKKELTALLKEVLFNKEKVPISELSKLGEFHHYTDEIYALSDIDFTKYIKDNLHAIRSIAGLFNVMLDPDPVSARKTLQSVKNMFNH